MRFMKKLGIFFAFAGAAGATLFASDAHALGPMGLEVAAKGAFGMDPVGDVYPNPMHFGVGGRAGVTVSSLYLGGSLVYYLGTKQNETVDGNAGQLSTSSLTYGGEVGYGFPIGGYLTVRSQVGVGNDKITVKGTGAAASDVFGGSETKGYLYVEPAAVVLVPLGSWFAGADVGALVLPTGPYKSSPCDKATCTSFDVALTVHLQAGFSF
jgi:hypothetical protein